MADTQREPEEERIRTLGEILDRLAHASSESGGLSIGEAMDVVGRRSFGPLLLLTGIITVAPIVGDIPGVPSLLGFLVLLIVSQILLGQEHVWIPDWLENRSLSDEKLSKAIDWLRKPARFADRMTRARMVPLIGTRGRWVIGISCVAIALTMPLLEFVPFSANGAGAALVAFGLAVTTDDGLLALVAFLLTVLTYGIVIYTVFF